MAVVCAINNAAKYKIIVTKFVLAFLLVSIIGCAALEDDNEDKQDRQEAGYSSSETNQSSSEVHDSLTEVKSSIKELFVNLKSFKEIVDSNFSLVNHSMMMMAAFNDSDSDDWLEMESDLANRTNSGRILSESLQLESLNSFANLTLNYNNLTDSNETSGFHRHRHHNYTVRNRKDLGHDLGRVVMDWVNKNRILLICVSVAVLIILLCCCCCVVKCLLC